jgi:hypothetical protein
MGMNSKLLKGLEPTGRFELPTSRLRIGCSTTELRRLARRHQNFKSRLKGALRKSAPGST